MEKITLGAIFVGFLLKSRKNREERQEQLNWRYNALQDIFQIRLVMAGSMNPDSGNIITEVRMILSVKADPVPVKI